MPYYAGKGHGTRAFTGRGHNLHAPSDSARILVFPMASEADAFESEIALIDLFGRKDLGTGCLRNMTDGGEGRAGAIASEETRRKQSAAKKGKPSPWKGKHPSFETREKQSESAKRRERQLAGWNKGLRSSARHRRKISEGLRRAYQTHPRALVSAATRQKMRDAKIGKPGNHTGFTVSTEAKQKMSVAKKGKPWSVARRAAHEDRRCQTSTV